jgi:hypothetical protein
MLHWQTPKEGCFAFKFSRLASHILTMVQAGPPSRGSRTVWVVSSLKLLPQKKASHIRVLSKSGDFKARFASQNIHFCTGAVTVQGLGFILFNLILVDSICGGP